MPFVDDVKIYNKVLDYANSAEGKKRMYNTAVEYVYNNIGVTNAGSEVITLDAMERAAMRLINIVRQNAIVNMLPQSVRNAVDSLVYDKPRQINRESFVVDLHFTDVLWRPSLTGVGGIDNIILLFDRGYKASRPVYGLWEGHEDLGIIRSRTEREGTHFLYDAINEFNDFYGSLYRAFAYLGTDFYF